MKRVKFSIAGLMGFVVVFALGFAGLKAANEIWASVSFTLVVVIMLLAIINAVQSREKDRAYWVGFAIMGSAHLGLVFGAMGPFRVIPPQLLTESLFDRLEAAIHPTVDSFTSATFTVTPLPAPPVPLYAPPQSPAPAPTQAVPVAPGKILTPPIIFTSPPGPMVVSTSGMSRVYFSQIAHSLAALLLGMLGGIYSAWLFGRQERREAALSPSSP